MLPAGREEAEELNRAQSVAGSQKHRDPRVAPYAFTEHGALMAANALNSPHPSAIISGWRVGIPGRFYGNSVKRFDTLLRAFQGLDRRKNSLPTGGVRVMLFVPLAVVME